MTRIKPFLSFMAWCFESPSPLSFIESYSPRQVAVCRLTPADTVCLLPKRLGVTAVAKVVALVTFTVTGVVSPVAEIVGALAISGASLASANCWPQNFQFFAAILGVAASISLDMLHPIIGSLSVMGPALSETSLLEGNHRCPRSRVLVL
ncbi:hypothetical protein BD289DRAFT_12727 [Coniella lustricola]|uniref:Uncharacterized protein n=1 Tax=Coniella lustricola TaxID=2025994 RepID=A0A2T3A4B5_9PEZI|nr:hypothetical protein BD289DRAFT_12727 [Coniella lustricola]